MRDILFWFRNDLRLHDNEALLRAADLGRVLPVYVIDPSQFDETKFGYKKTGVYRAKFLLESLQDLKKNLQSKGSDLIIRIGDPSIELAKIAQERDVLYVLASKEVTQEETSLEFELSQNLKRLNIDMELIWQATLYHVRDLPFQIKFLPDVFTEFRKKMDKQSKVRPALPEPGKLKDISDIELGEIPHLKDLGFDEEDQSDSDFYKGGEKAGLERLQYFVWESQNIKTYKETRNGLLGNEFSSKLSAWISLGCVSPRKIYHEVRKFEKEVVKNESTYWVIFELIWRDYFHLVALKYGIRLFKRCGIQHDLIKDWRGDKDDYKKWMKGVTGIPFVDANMRELNATGFMSNRGRQIVTSFFTKDLRLEWWWGAMYFESKLIDYDVCSNWGNWNYIAGIGNDPRPNRYFNISKQGEKYDPEAEYIKHWLPELKNVPAAVIHNFDKASESELEGYGLRPGKDYPKPMMQLP
ncbi:DASH family cryptochrome [Jiulongibacter sediminis]|uniref:Cryptochrome DASH n=1 Tax=Jiulongibacter sediminis TaxID=1605367 RepID=A0A0P7BA18_9BACT|nr:DASH family cryptochrome [Jiulongibacter sediminis]KPM47186.1 cryptochrome DASH [Jiulongibacter sediminis]TBX22744.1 cryptochrome DASH [Jiulongibacter sediminis]